MSDPPESRLGRARAGRPRAAGRRRARGRHRARRGPGAGRRDRRRTARSCAGAIRTARARRCPGAADARTLYKDLGLDPTKVAALERGAAAPRAEGRGALHGEHAGGRAEPLLAAGAAPVRPVRPRPRGAAGRRCAAAGPARATRASARPRCNVDGRPVLVDAQGPFGNPTSDSARTMITLGLPARARHRLRARRYPPARLAAVLDDTAATLTRCVRRGVGARRLA